MIKIIDNYLPEEQFRQMQSHIMGINFPWFYVPTRDTPEDSKYNLVHMFYNDNFWWDDAKIIKPLLDKLTPLSLIRIKLNSTVPEHQVSQNQFHVDYSNQDHFTTCIMYMNTNDGYTEFETGEKIESIENRLVMFPCHMKHRGTTSTTRRVVLNINYLQWKYLDGNS